MTKFDSIWAWLTDEQIKEVEKAYAKRIKALKAEGSEPEEMDAYEALSRHAEDFDDIESFDDMMGLLAQMKAYKIIVTGANEDDELTIKDEYIAASESDALELALKDLNTWSLGEGQAGISMSDGSMVQGYQQGSAAGS